jgi:hypothetical protein
VGGRAAARGGRVGRRPRRPAARIAHAGARPPSLPCDALPLECRCCCCCH